MAASVLCQSWFCHYDWKARMIDEVRLEWLLYQQWPSFEQEITMNHDQKTIKSPLLKVH